MTNAIIPQRRSNAIWEIPGKHSCDAFPGRLKGANLAAPSGTYAEFGRQERSPFMSQDVNNLSDEAQNLARIPLFKRLDPDELEKLSMNGPVDSKPARPF